MINKNATLQIYVPENKIHLVRKAEEIKKQKGTSISSIVILALESFLSVYDTTEKKKK